MNSPLLAAFSVGRTPVRAARSTGRVRLSMVALALVSVCCGAVAQYRIVAPDGSVTYTDKPPAANPSSKTNANATATPIRPGSGMAARTGPGATAVPGGGALPYEVQQAATRYPVTLYAARACSACDSSRQWLRGHGIPFREYSVDSNTDLVELRQRFGDLTVPVVTIGSQTLKGFSASDLQAYADAAGYPKQARLTGYAWPAASPLAPAAVVPAAALPAPSSPSVTLPPPSKSGIQF